MQHLPKDIFETYNRLLTRIAEEGSLETCNKVFQYVAAAKRPLTLDELGEAISLEPYQTCFMPERLINNPKGIIRWCHGLIAMHDLDDTLQFAHSSVKDFFCSPETERSILRGFHFQPNEADCKLGEICVTYLSFNDFKTQLIKPPKPQTPLDPMMMTSYALSGRSPGVVLNKARDLMMKRSKSTLATSKLLLPRDTYHASHAVVRSYHFLQYASEFWPTHTTEFSPKQGRLWNFFRTLAEERYPVLSQPDISTSLQNPDGRVTAFRDFVFSHQHQALFRQWMARKWHAKDLPLTVALLLRWECFSFVRLLPPLAKTSQSSWLAGLLSLDIHDLQIAI